LYSEGEEQQLSARGEANIIRNLEMYDHGDNERERNTPGWLARPTDPDCFPAHSLCGSRPKGCEFADAGMRRTTIRQRARDISERLGSRAVSKAA
jgi:hypothetical protein